MCVFKITDHRLEFSKWWTTEFKTVKFPTQGTVFDYYIEPESKKFEPWNKLVPKFTLDPELPLQVNIIHLKLNINIKMLNKFNNFSQRL